MGNQVWLISYFNTKNINSHDF